MSTENAEVISQTPATEKNVEELKTEAKKVLEQASVNNKRSLEVADETSNPVSEGNDVSNDESSLAKNGNKNKKQRIAKEDNEDSNDVEEDEEEDEEDEGSEADGDYDEQLSNGGDDGADLNEEEDGAEGEEDDAGEDD